MPEVSVLLPVRDGARTLALAMLSVLEQSFRDFELLVLDDGSADASAEIARRFGDPRVRVLRDGAKRGLAARLNQGIDAAAGRYIARMDADDVCWRERLAHQVARLNRETALDLLACRVLDFDDRGRVTGLRPYRLDHAALCAQPWNGFYLVHPSWIGRADWFRRHRYRTPELARAQDQELLLRAYPQSRFAVLDEILLGYRAAPLALGKLLAARRCLLGAQLAQFSQRGQWGFLLLALAATGAKLTRDLLQRALPRPGVRSGIPPDIAARWAEWLGFLQARLAQLELPPGLESIDLPRKPSGAS